MKLVPGERENSGKILPFRPVQLGPHEVRLRAGGGRPTDGRAELVGNGEGRDQHAEQEPGVGALTSFSSPLTLWHNKLDYLSRLVFSEESKDQSITTD